MIEKYGDLYASVFFLIFAIFMYIATLNFQQSDLVVLTIGSEFVPQLAAGGIFIFAFLLLIKGIKTAKAMNKDEAADVQTSKPFHKTKVFTVGATILLIVLYVTLITQIGFLITTVVYLVLQMYVLAEPIKRNLFLFVSIAIITSGSVYFVFREFFNLFLPSGILG
ncbi:hypothetical protein HNR44_000618 [Geomicrobium halophilum]|uniref:DUF1468 domain-containing protein n=1 Tax=Geomicrobium halophilum TaxID=549000 RepID=A0A841PIW0_9BACL|nr:tripartite tricarboxylate transporter TctB family protein [Geomicrobium halophilum]MBB6448669.1 hypothetical protein [Geomicrobium halophilum]